MEPYTARLMLIILKVEGTDLNIKERHELGSFEFRALNEKIAQTMADEFFKSTITDIASRPWIEISKTEKYLNSNSTKLVVRIN